MRILEGQFVKQKLEIQKKQKRNQKKFREKKELRELHCKTYRLENLTDFMRNQIYN